MRCLTPCRTEFGVIFRLGACDTAVFFRTGQFKGGCGMRTQVHSFGPGSSSEHNFER